MQQMVTNDYEAGAHFASPWEDGSTTTIWRSLYGDNEMDGIANAPADR